MKWRPIVLSLVIALLAVTCENPKTVLVDNQCSQTIWLRFTDQPAATLEQLGERTAYMAKENETIRVDSSVFDPDEADGTIAVSESSMEIGKRSRLPHSETNEIRVTVTGELCP